MSLKPLQVIEKQNEYYYNYPACGQRSKHKLGKKVTDEYENVRKITQKFFHAKNPKEIIFTKNTTESINLISNSLSLKKGDEVLTSDKEHNSNLVPWQLLKQKGIIHKIAEFNNLKDFENKITKNTRLVSIVHTSNVDGTTQDIKQIIKLAHENNSLVLIDAAQSAPHKPINVQNLDIDFLACSGHKMLGPTGTGILYGKYDLLKNLNPFLVGGDTVVETTYTSVEFEQPPHKFEAGLQNYAGIIGLGEALNYLMKIGLENIHTHEIKLNKIITDQLLKENKIQLLGPSDPSQRGGIFSFNIKNLDPHQVAIILDQQNILLRAGAHCVHSWFNKNKLNASIRASLYLYNTQEEAQRFIDEVKKIIKLLA